MTELSCHQIQMGTWIWREPARTDLRTGGNHLLERRPRSGGQCRRDVYVQKRQADVLRLDHIKPVLRARRADYGQPGNPRTRSRQILFRKDAADARILADDQQHREGYFQAPSLSPARVGTPRSPARTTANTSSARNATSWTAPASRSMRSSKPRSPANNRR